MAAIGRPLGQPVSNRVHRVMHHPVEHMLGPQRHVRAQIFLIGASDFLVQFGGHEELQLLSESELSHPPRRLHQLVLAHARADCQRRLRARLQLHVRATTTALIKEDEGILLVDRGAA